MKFVAALGSFLIGLIPNLGINIQAQVADASTSKTTVRVGVYQNAPRIFLDDTGTPTGFWVDLLEPIAQTEGWRLEYVPCEWDHCLRAIEKGQLDLMVDVAYSEERDRQYAFNEQVVFVSWSEIYARTGLALNSLLDLDEKRVAVLRGSIQQAALGERAQALQITPTLVPVDDFHEVFRQLESGEVDAGVVNRFFAAQEASHYNVQRTNLLLQPSFIHIIAPEGDGEPLLAAIDEALAAMDADPDSAYHRATEKWLEPDRTLTRRDIRQILLETIIYVPLVALMASFWWNRKLKREIDRRQQAETRLQTLADNTPGVIYQYVLYADGSDGLLYISSGSISLWGVEAEAAIQDMNQLWEKVHPEDLAPM